MGQRLLFVLLAVGCGRVGFGDATADVRSDDGSNDAFVRCAFGPFSPTLHHVATLNSANFDWGPTVSADDLTLYFSSGRGTDEDIYRATRATTADPWTTAGLISSSPPSATRKAIRPSRPAS